MKNARKNASSENYSKWTPLQSEIECLLSCMEHENISKASERLGMNQANLSKIIQKVEAELGQKLFIRSPRGIQTTPYGHQLAQSIRKLKTVWENEILSFKQNEQVFSGQLRIGCHNSVANDCFPQLVVPLANKFPSIEFDFDFDRSPEITRKLTKMELDIGLVINPVKNTDLIARHIKEEFISIWSYGASENATLLYNPAMFMSEKVLKRYSGERKIQIQDYEVIANMIRQGNCHGVLPSPVAERYKLKQESGKLLSVNLSLVWHKDRFKTEGQQNLVKEILELLKSPRK